LTNNRSLPTIIKRRIEILIKQPNLGESFGERLILLKFKEGYNKGLGSWFMVTGLWLKEKTRNYKQETKNQIFK